MNSVARGRRAKNFIVKIKMLFWELWQGLESENLKRERFVGINRQVP
jgi:hypothetical protein